MNIQEIENTKLFNILKTVMGENIAHNVVDNLIHRQNISIDLDKGLKGFNWCDTTEGWHYWNLVKQLHYAKSTVMIDGV